MATEAPTRLSEWASAAPLWFVLISAVAAPALAMPIHTDKYSTRLGIISATVSPRPRPRDSAQRA